MNIFELLLFLLPLFLCFFLGEYLYRHIGWCGVIPVVLLGLGWAAFPFAVAKGIIKFRRNVRK
jgi:hypothetical protein